MSKKNLTPRQKTIRFWLILLVIAEVYLALVGIGLFLLWDFLEAFEASRPQNAISAYMEQLTPEKLSGMDEDLTDGIDTAICSEEACRQIVADSLAGGISYAKNTKESSDDRYVYMVISSGKTVGKVAMTVESTDNYGFEYWSITEESFDFSHLIGRTASITVPEEFSVYANGVLLDASHVTESGIRYASVSEYYAEYDLPTMCTYTAGPVLGEVVLTVKDGEGNPVEMTADMNMDQFLQNCSDEELESVDTFLDGFVAKYTDFISVSGGKDNLQRNYRRLAEYIVDGSKLEQRMEEAIVGLIWVTDRNAKVDSVTIHNCLRLEDGKYLCDFTYVVNTRDHSGKVQSSTNVKMIVVETEDGLKAESMTSY